MRCVEFNAINALLEIWLLFWRVIQFWILHNLITYATFSVPLSQLEVNLFSFVKLSLISIAFTFQERL